MNRQPLAILASCFASGILAQDYFGLPKMLIIVSFGVSLLFLALLFLPNIFFQRLKPWILGLVCFAWGASVHFLNSEKPNLPKFHGKRAVTFQLDKKLNSNEQNRRYRIQFLHNDQSFGAVISAPKELPELDFAHWYKADLDLKEIKQPLQDYQFDYSKYMQRQHIYFKAFLPDSFSAAKRKNLTLLQKIKQHRSDLLQKINRSEISERSREFMKGIVLADRTEMDAVTVNDFSKTGLVHILAISGTHIVIIFGIIFLIFKMVLPAKAGKYVIIASLAFIWLFAIYIGMGSSVVRACLMLTAYYTSFLLQRKTDVLHAMAMAAFFILLADTQQIFDVGFQLSFLAVLGIYWFNKPLLKFLPTPKNDLQKWIFNIPTITLSAQLMTLPLVLYYFHQFSSVSLAANLIIIPFSELLIIGSLIMTMMIGLDINLPLIGQIYDFVIQKLLNLIHWLGALDAGMHTNVPMHWTEVIILFATLFFLGKFLKSRFPKTGWNMVVMAALFLSARWLLDEYYEKKSEFLVHQNYNDQTVSIKESKTVTFYVSEDTDLKNFQKYTVDPYLTSRRAENYTVKTLPKNVSVIRWKGKTVALNSQKAF